MFSLTSGYIPIVPFAKAHQSDYGLTDHALEIFQNVSVQCGFQAVLDQVTYPPTSKIDLPNGNRDIIFGDCDIYDEIYAIGERYG